MARLFDHYIVVDWSASSSPKLGADSIWYCIADACVCKPLARDVGLQSIIGSERGEAAKRRSKRYASKIGSKELGASSVAETDGMSASTPRVAKGRGRKEMHSGQLAADITEAASFPASVAVVDQRLKRPRVACPPSLAKSDTSTTVFHSPTNKCATPGMCTAAVPVVENVPTRAMAEAVLVEKLVGLVARGRRVLLGFDFSMGFSRGFAAALAEKTPVEYTGELAKVGSGGSAAESTVGMVDGAEVSDRSGPSASQRPGWESVWQYLHQNVVDEDNNSNNRFEVAARMNKMVSLYSKGLKCHH